MSTSTSVLHLPGRTVDRRSPWVLVATAAIGAAIALSVTTLAGRGSNPAPAARPAVQAPAGAPETVGSISSLRPFSDAGFAFSAEQSVPAAYRPGVVFNYPAGTVRIGVDGGAPFQAGYQQGTTHIAAASNAGNENAPAVPNCHQCR